jgi:hypothetical protein
MVAAIDTMAFVGQVPWHKQGEQVSSEDEMYSWEKFYKRAGLDWTVRKERLVTMTHAKDIIANGGNLEHGYGRSKISHPPK